ASTRNQGNGFLDPASAFSGSAFSGSAFSGNDSPPLSGPFTVFLVLDPVELLGPRDGRAGAGLPLPGYLFQRIPIRGCQAISAKFSLLINATFRSRKSQSLPIPIAPGRPREKTQCLPMSSLRIGPTKKLNVYQCHHSQPPGPRKTQCLSMSSL